MIHGPYNIKQTEAVGQQFPRHKRGKISRKLRKLHNEKLLNLYYTPTVIRMSK